MELVPLSELVAAVHGQAPDMAGEVQIKRVCTDSRELQRGDLFWALRGETHDGHDHVAEALKKGALACVVEHGLSHRMAGPLVRVDDTLAALADFARWYRHQRETLIIGVTGSVGKTTTKEMIYSALSEAHRGVRSQKSYNNEIGLPLSLLELNAEDEFGVFEMGARHVGEVRALCEIAVPEVGVIPKVGLAHLGSFGSPENIYLAKGELLDALPPHGFAVIGGDDERMREMAVRSMCGAIFVGEKPGNHLRATEIDVTPQRLKFLVERKKYEVPGASRQLLTAALCAIAVAKEVGLSPGEIAAGLSRFVPQPGRSQMQTIGSWTVVDDTYNANPTSMHAACLSLRDWPASGPRLFIAGDMLELGESAMELHAELGAIAAGCRFDRVLTVGEFAETVAHGAISAGLPRQSCAVCQNLDVLWLLLDCWLAPGAVVLVKGSRAMHMEKVVDWLKQRAAKELSASKGTSARSRRAVA